jgi:hypothetical protein
VNQDLSSPNGEEADRFPARSLRSSVEMVPPCAARDRVLLPAAPIFKRRHSDSESVPSASSGAAGRMSS